MSAESVEDKKIDVANDNWIRALGLAGGNERFVLSKKTKVSDIEKMTDSIESISKEDDKIHKENLENENKLLKKYEDEKRLEEEKSKKLEEAANKVAATAKKPIILNIQDDKLSKTIDSSNNEENKGVADSKSPSVKTQTQELATPPDTIDKKETKTGLLKNITKGLAHLYVNKTSKILNPVKFIIDNYRKFSMALFQLGVPALITWYIVQMPFVNSQIESTGSVMSVVYMGIFYFAVLFLWCLFLFLMYMGGRMIKREAMEVAKIGKEDKE